MRAKFSLCLALILSLSVAGISRAQPGIPYESSLEAMIAKSPFVFRGSISSYSRTIISAPWTNFVRGVTTGPQEGQFIYTMLFQVDEVLKGSPRKTLELSIPMDGSDKKVEQWADQHTELLCFTYDPAADYGAGKNAPKPLSSVIILGKAVPAEQTVLTAWAVRLPVRLMDSTEVSDPWNILAAARSFTKQNPTVTNTFWLPRGWYALEVPITPALEKMARQLIQSNDPSGIEALGCFKSPKNIRLLKRFLNDTNFYDTTIQNCPWINKRIYRMRQAAYEVLNKWGVNVPKPVCEERLPWHYQPGTRQPLEVRIPTSLWSDSWSAGSDSRTVEVTNVLAGSNMITGLRVEWFLYRDGQPRPSKPFYVDQNYWPMMSSLAYFNRNRDGILPGQKYVVEMNYTLFETDNPPVAANDPDEIDTVNWRPQDGKNYRVFLQRTLTQAFQF